MLSPDTVLELVPDVSWSSANLDLVEMNVIRHVDGVSPLSLLQTMVGISQDELQVMLAMLLARQLIMVVQVSKSGVWSEQGSGVFDRVSLGLEALLANTG